MGYALRFLFMFPLKVLSKDLKGWGRSFSYYNLLLFLNP